MQTKPLIIADRDIPFLEGVLEPYAEVRYLKGSAITANDVRGAEVLITRTRTYRLRPHRHGLLPQSRHPRHHGGRMQCARGTAIHHGRTVPPRSGTGLAAI